MLIDLPKSSKTNADVEKKYQKEEARLAWLENLVSYVFTTACAHTQKLLAYALEKLTPNKDASADDLERYSTFFSRILELRSPHSQIVMTYAQTFTHF